MTSGAVIGMVVIVLLLFCSAMISGSEVAYFSMKPLHIFNLKELPISRQEQMVLNLLEKPERLLANILITNNFINVGIVIIAAHVTGSLFDFSATPVLGFVIQVVAITFLLLLFGEIMPKVYANRFAPQFARMMARPLSILDRLFQPLIFILIKSTGLVNRRLAKKRQNISMDDISEALDLTDVVKDEKEMLEGIVRFSNLEVSEIMKPRTDVVAVDLETELNSLIGLINESGYSRIPVYEETSDHLKGILYVKDLIPYINQKEHFKWQKLIREPFFVPETKKINDLLKEFQEKKIHLAIVVDEYGGTEGIVTMEDILEEVVGEITDESDGVEKLYRRINARTTIFDGKTLLNDFYKVTGLDDELFDDVKGDAETVAGLLLELKGGFPMVNDVIHCKGVEFTVMGMDKRRIKEIKVYLKQL